MTGYKDLFSQECSFVAGAATFSAIPQSCGVPEVAFAGRSNVGKSSLINSLVNRGSLARISNTPGRTQQINFFSLGGRICLVDLPGYGYADVSKQIRCNWGDLIVRYLETRSTLKRVFLLIDSRRGIKPQDEEIMDIFGKIPVVFQVVFTKIDKIQRSEFALIMVDTIKNLAGRAVAYPDIIATSSRDKSGIDEIRTQIGGFVI